MQYQNSIRIDGDGNITIRDVANGNMTIYTNDPAEILEQLKQLNGTQIDSLLQVVEKQQEQFSDYSKLF